MCPGNRQIMDVMGTELQRNNKPDSGVSLVETDLGSKLLFFGYG